MSKVFIATIAFNKADFTEECILNFRKTTDPEEYTEHVLFDPGYPIDQLNNSAALQKIAVMYDMKYVPIENKGCHLNFQQTFEHFNPGDEDIYIPLCPDARPGQPQNGATHSWLKTMTDVLREDNNCFTCQANRHIDYKAYNKRDYKLAGHNVVKFEQLVAWSFGGFRADWIKRIGGFNAPSKYYGYVEHYLCDHIQPLGGHWLFMKDYFDQVPACPDQIYLQWKIDSASAKTTLKFEEWLKTLEGEQK